MQKKPHLYPFPERIIRHGIATVVIFDDGSKAVVRLKDGDQDDIYDAICAAIAKRFVGSSAEIKRLLDSVEHVPEKPKAKRTKKSPFKFSKTVAPCAPFSAIELFHELFDEMQERP